MRSIIEDIIKLGKEAYSMKRLHCYDFEPVKKRCSLSVPLTGITVCMGLLYFWKYIHNKSLTLYTTSKQNENVYKIHPALVELYKNKKRKQKELWISNIVFCPRKEFISYFFGDLPEIDDDTLAGLYLRNLIQSYLKERGYEIKKKIEYDIGDGWKLVGSVDAVKDRVIRIRTTECEALNGIKMVETNLYAYILNRKEYEIIYVDRKTGFYRSTVLRTDDEGAEAIIKTADILRKKYIKKKKLPEVKRDNLCTLCVYNLLCGNINSIKLKL